jgi:hypothetical protein
MNTEQMMDFLFERRARNLPAHALAEIFDRLLWTMDDNGAEVLAVRRKWLQLGDRERVLIALAMSEAHPCVTRDALIELCDSVSKRFPDLATKCNELIQIWNRDIGGS